MVVTTDQLNSNRLFITFLSKSGKSKNGFPIWDSVSQGGDVLERRQPVYGKLVELLVFAD